MFVTIVIIISRLLLLLLLNMPCAGHRSSQGWGVAADQPCAHEMGHGSRTRQAEEGEEGSPAEEPGPKRRQGELQRLLTHAQCHTFVFDFLWYEPLSSYTCFRLHNCPSRGWKKPLWHRLLASYSLSMTQALDFGVSKFD